MHMRPPPLPSPNQHLRLLHSHLIDVFSSRHLLCLLCLQAFAQVMLMQQETIAGLMRMLEEAKAEAAAVLLPLTRPPSPAKRRALASEAEATGRVRQDRWAGRVRRCLVQLPSSTFATIHPPPSSTHSPLPTFPAACREALIQELRDAFVALADTSAANQAALPEFEARIRELHAALEAAGDSGLASLSLSPAAGQLAAGQASPQKQPRGAKVHGGADEEDEGSPGERWAIPAARTSAAQPAPAGGRLKSALKQPRPSSASWSPARPAAGRRADQSVAAQASGRTAVSRPATAPGLHLQPAQQEEEKEWQPDDGLAVYEAAEVAQRAQSLPSSSGPAAQGAAPAADAAPQPCSRPASAVPVPHRAAGSTAPHPASRSSSPQRSRPGSPQRSRPGSPSPAQVSGIVLPFAGFAAAVCH